MLLERLVVPAGALLSHVTRWCACVVVMSRLPRRPTADMNEDQREFFNQMAEGRPPVEDGHIGGPFDVWALTPDVGRRVWKLGGSIRFKSTIDRRYIELAILVVGQLWEAQFEWFAHEPMARDAGLPEDVIQAIKRGEKPSFTDAGDEACWNLCTTLHRDHREEANLEEPISFRFKSGEMRNA